MKITLLFFLLFFPAVLLAQVRRILIQGTVIDSATGTPLEQVSVYQAASGRGTLTDEDGRYSLSINQAGPIRFSYLGYKETSVLVPRLSENLNINVSLSVMSYFTKELNITARKMYKLDSLNFRKANQDIFTASRQQSAGVAPVSAHSANYGPNVGFSPSVFYTNYISAKGRRIRAYRKVLEKSEKQTYIDSRYNDEVVTSITGLRGEALTAFMDKNEPAYDWLTKASDYDLYAFILARYKDIKPAQLQQPASNAAQK